MKLRTLGLAVLAAVLGGGVAASYGNMLLAPEDEEAALAHHMGPKERLGRMLFNDTALSEPAGQSCASCHDPGTGWAEPRGGFPTSLGRMPNRFIQRT